MVAKVEFHAGKLFPRAGFIVTNLETDSPGGGLQQRLVNTGGRLIRHARYFWLLLAEGHLAKRPFAAMLRRIAALPLPSG